ncbi:MAG: mannose-1-phosphate guanylyltransferase [Planctomycetota bacterium]|jgi:mannose-1-phosphate guanylyltransferase
MQKTPLPEIIPVIMAGGTGTRFWPLSTAKKPKQFLHLFGDRSLLRMSFERASTLAAPEKILVLTNRAFLPEVRRQIPEIPESNVIGEPLRRDTAAAVALASLIARKRFGNPVMTILTADHLIEPVEAFQRAQRSASRGARETGSLYTFGVPPTYPATAYGYLERGEKVLDDEGIEHFRLRGFREKPDAEKAQRYVASGDYLWNSGMFVWTADAILAELQRQLPAHLSHLSPVVEKGGDDEGGEILQRAFERLETISIDFGVMEHAENVRCVAAPFNWEDVGGWLALETHLPQDEALNAHRAHLHSLEAVRNLVFSEDPEELVALVGVRDLIVVRSGRRTLIASKDHAESVKTLVQLLEPGP